MKFISTKSVRLILITAHFMFRRIWELTNGLIPFKNSIKHRYIFHVFYYYFFFKSNRCQLATFVEILVAKYIFHSPWRPKRSQRGALIMMQGWWLFCTHELCFLKIAKWLIILLYWLVYFSVRFFFFFSSGASMSLQSFFAKPFKRDFNAYV